MTKDGGSGGRTTIIVALMGLMGAFVGFAGVALNVFGPSLLSQIQGKPIPTLADRSSNSQIPPSSIPTPIVLVVTATPPVAVTNFGNCTSTAGAFLPGENRWWGPFLDGSQVLYDKNEGKVWTWNSVSGYLY